MTSVSMTSTNKIEYESVKCSYGGNKKQTFSGRLLNETDKINCIYIATVSFNVQLKSLDKLVFVCL